MRLLTLVDKHKQECRYDDEGDDTVGKNQSGSEDALATIGTPGRRMAHPIPTIRAELLRWLVSHFSTLVNPNSSSAQPSHSLYIVRVYPVCPKQGEVLKCRPHDQLRWARQEGHRRCDPESE